MKAESRQIPQKLAARLKFFTVNGAKSETETVLSLPSGENGQELSSC